MRRLQDVCTVQAGPLAISIQHHVLRLHAFAIASCRDQLVKALELEVALILREDLARYPSATSAHPALLHRHSRVIQHIVDGPEERRDL